MPSSDLYLRSVKTIASPPTPRIDANLHAFDRASTVEHWEPGTIYVHLPHWERSPSHANFGRDVVFGAISGDDVYVIGYKLKDGTAKNVVLFRDGGSMEVTAGVPTQAGEKVVHFFAIFGENLLTPAMRSWTKKVNKLTQPQVAHVFRALPNSTLQHLVPLHARRRAMSSLRRVRSARR